MTIDRDQLKRELRTEIVAELLKTEAPQSIDERIANAQSSSELESIFQEAERAATPPAPELEVISSYAEYEQRQAAYDNALASVQTTEALKSLMEVLGTEAQVLAEAERRYSAQESDDEETLDKIRNAESVEELEGLTNSDAHQARQAQQERLAQWRGDTQ